MKIAKKDISLFLLLLPVFKPMCMNFSSITNWGYRGILVITMGIIVLSLVKNHRKPTSVTVLLMVLEGIMLIGTVFSQGSIMDALWRALGIMQVALLIELCAKIGDIRRLIRCMMLHLELCTYINLITLLIKPNGFFARLNEAYGLTQEWFLGADNYFVIWAVPAFLVAYLYKEYTGKSTRSYLLIMVTVITQFIHGSATGLVAIIIFAIWLVIPGLRKVMTPLVCAIAAVVLFTTIVIFQTSDYLEPIVTGILGKNMTFSNRLLIWGNSIVAILQSPLWGHGILASQQATELLGKAVGGLVHTSATHCHCQFLQVAFQSGISGIIIYCIMLVKSFVRCNKHKASLIAQACTICLFIFCVISITEVYEYPQMYMLFILPFYMDELIAAGAMTVKENKLETENTSV